MLLTRCSTCVAKDTPNESTYLTAKEMRTPINSKDQLVMATAEESTDLLVKEVQLPINSLAQWRSKRH